MTELTTLIDLFTKGGLVTALLVALWGGMRGWYVWKDTHEDALKVLQETLKHTRQEKDKQIEDLHGDRDYWREQAIRCMSNNGRLVNVFESPKTQDKRE